MKSPVRRRAAPTVLAAAVLVAAAAVGLAGCAKAPDAAAKLRIGIMPDAAALPLFLIDGVATVPFQSARDRDAALAAGELDGIIGDLVTAIAHRQQGIGLKVVTAAESRFLLVGRPDLAAGLAAGTRRGPVTIGLSENTVAEYLVDALAADLGVPIVKTPVAQAQLRVELLRSGQLDLAILADALAWPLLAEGFVAVRDQAGSGLEPVALLFSDAALAGRAAAVARCLAGWDTAAAAINADPAAFQARLFEQARLPDSGFAPPRYRPAALPSVAQVQSAIDWYRAKFGLAVPTAYGDLVAAVPR
jgi:NitT/TauT family transport system substrate-binding protein